MRSPRKGMGLDSRSISQLLFKKKDYKPFNIESIRSIGFLQLFTCNSTVYKFLNA